MKNRVNDMKRKITWIIYLTEICRFKLKLDGETYGILYNIGTFLGLLKLHKKNVFVRNFRVSKFTIKN